MFMDLRSLLEESWGLCAQRIEPFEDRHANPHGRGLSWVIDGAYLLRSAEERLAGPKQFENRLIRGLGERGIPVLAAVDEQIVARAGSIYQLFPYIPQPGGARINYHRELGKAAEIGRVLGQMAGVDAAGMFREQAPESQVSLPEEIERSRKRIALTDYDVIAAAGRACGCLEQRLFAFLPYLETRFSHGDLHPANLLWQDGRLAAMIDWEQAGTRVELYDLAFLIGCAGRDDPAAPRVILTVRGKGYMFNNSGE